MNLILKKVKSTSGATIIMALIFLLICVTISAIIITASMANAVKLEKRKQEQQAYLSVASSAEILRENIKNMSCELFQEDWQYTCGFPDDTHLSQGLKKSGLSVWTFSKNSSGDLLKVESKVWMHKYINESVKGLIDNSHFQPKEEKFIMEDSKTKIKNTVLVKMNDNFNLSFILTANATKDNEYTISFVAKSLVTTLPGEDDKSKSCGHWVKERDSRGRLVDVYRKYPYTITTYRKQINWSLQPIRQGVN